MIQASASPAGDTPPLCQSRITDVTVYARGAIVTRKVTLPTLATDPTEVQVDAISPSAEPGSFRIEDFQARPVNGVRATLVRPQTYVPPGELRAQLEKLEHALSLAESNLALACEEENRVSGVDLNLSLNSKRYRHRVAARLAEGLAMSEVLDEMRQTIAEEIVRRRKEVEVLRKEIEVLERDIENARPDETKRQDAPHTRVSVQLGEGPAQVDHFFLKYRIPQARWWPSYLLRLSGSSTRADLSLRAWVAQSSLEDWDGVSLTLSTADMVRELQLPELPSMRLGKVVPPKPRGFRPPPAGLAALFESYDAARGAMLPSSGGRTTRPVLSRAAPPPQGEITMAVQMVADAPAGFGGAGRDDDFEDSYDEEMLEVDALQSMPPPAPRAAPAAKSMSAPPEMMRSRGAMSIGAAAAPAKKRKAGSARREARRRRLQVPPPALGLGDEWLDFGQLRMAAADEPNRGQLHRRPFEAVHAPNLGAPSAQYITDPQAGRGSFDHQYGSTGAVDVPGSGQAHLVELLSAEAPARSRFVTVPREDTNVFREVVLDNPLLGPILAGPIEVFVDGSLLTTTALAAVGRGGTFSVGLGAEDRIRVVRNARAEETSSGVFGGTTEVEHRVSYDIRSSLGFPLQLEMRERIPVSDDKNVEISVVQATPPTVPYDQQAEGRPIRGGVKWLLSLDASAAKTVLLHYRIELSSKSEIEGGNRREA